jgi:DASH complex subunit DAM1
MPSHPLRRISTGSLSSLARSTDRTHAPSDLDFLEPAITELVDEAATLASNVQRLNALHEALGTFNEGFSAYMYAIKMNAFSMAWPEVSGRCRSEVRNGFVHGSDDR